MTHPVAKLRLPEEIKTRTLEFLNWYFNNTVIDGFNDPFHRSDGFIHIEGDDWELDWRPRSKEISRLTLVDHASGMIATNGFVFHDVLPDGERPHHSQPVPNSLLMTTWFDLCHTLERISDGRRAELDERLRTSIEHDLHQLGTILYG